MRATAALSLLFFFCFYSYDGQLPGTGIDSAHSLGDRQDGAANNRRSGVEDLSVCRGLGLTSSKDALGDVRRPLDHLHPALLLVRLPIRPTRQHSYPPFAVFSKQLVETKACLYKTYYCLQSPHIPAVKPMGLSDQSVINGSTSTVPRRRHACGNARWRSRLRPC
jgi:hypothetical protein